MKYIVLTAVAVFGVFSITNVTQAQHSRFQYGYNYQAPSRYVQIERVAPRPRVIDTDYHCDELGFDGVIVRGGLLVTHIHHGQLACEAGLSEGDTILKAGAHTIDCLHEWECALNDAGRYLPMLVSRRGCGALENVRVRMPVPPRTCDLHHDRYPTRYDNYRQPRNDFGRYNLPPVSQNNYGYNPGPVGHPHDERVYNVNVLKEGLRFGLSFVN